MQYNTIQLIMHAKVKGFESEVLEFESEVLECKIMFIVDFIPCLHQNHILL
jgi:hypothetical protein